MRKPFTLLAAAGAFAALATPAVADKPVDKGPSAHAPKVKVPSAQKQCRDERTAMGKDTFNLTYGTNKNQRNAFGKCVSKRNAATRDARKAARGDRSETASTVKDEVKADITAAKTCKADRKADADAFAEKYGTRRNAFGKCVSQTAREAHES
jgi:hypothetical protein